VAKMNSDLQRFLHAVRTLAKLARTYDDEAFLEALGRYATVQQEGDVWFVGTFLDGIGSELSKRRVDRRCRQCGKEIMTPNQRIAGMLGVSAGTVRADVGENDERDVRADAQYCGPACRQRAYRSRVTANAEKRKPKRNENGTSLRLGQQKRQRAITNLKPRDGQARTTGP
jgi:hypothetical protein